MSRIALVIVSLFALIGSASAQKSEIEALNAKWIEFFNRGDFAGIASLYADDATALPAGAAMVRGRAAVGSVWKSRDASGQRWKSSARQGSDPKLTPLDVKPLGPSAAREIGMYSLKTKGP